MATMPSRAACLGYSLPWALLLAGCVGVAPQSTKLQGELALDVADPVIDAVIAGVPVRLRVDLAAHDTIELNPATAARLPLKYESGPDVYVGRIVLTGRTAFAKVRIGAVEQQLQLVEHGRDCCVGVDGAIGPQLLPYGRVVWRNPAAPAPNGAVALLLDDDESTGLSALVPREVAGIRVRFGLRQAQSGATAAAGAILAKAWGGSWDGPEQRVPAAFDIKRPARAVLFAHPATLAGFRFDRLMVRTADFGGGERLPVDPVGADEIVVSKKLPRQEAWPAVTLGADRLDRCVEIAFAAMPRTLTLRCAFD
jgi:hypothetical protein